MPPRPSIRATTSELSSYLGVVDVPVPSRPQKKVVATELDGRTQVNALLQTIFNLRLEDRLREENVSKMSLLRDSSNCRCLKFLLNLVTTLVSITPKSTEGLH